MAARFAMPKKGSLGSSLSMLQAVKLKEIAGKASGRKAPWQRKPWRIPKVTLLLDVASTHSNSVKFLLHRSTSEGLLRRQ